MPSEPWALPESMSVEDFATLLELELDAVEQGDIDRLVKLGRLWIGDKLANQPIRENTGYECQIGFPVFSRAKDHWLKMSAKSASVAI